ncbi:MAG: hypothetical protein AUI61_02400 [Thaumarchaeota archaeon 13_1_40CM_2_39_13_2]|nr:MAG: hypothetical protein AUI61_02400 [Thaumarchaeota archaeon 13_1_40CM_2_39_13_2]OLE41143.1 MAG: hypothetical protein AUG16_01065 [Thaumarchaeota archaeon 13_1_20CM_2_39_20]
MFRLNKRVKEPDEVPQKLEEKINYKVFGLIFAAVIAFQMYLYTFKNPDDPQLSLIATLADFITPLVAAIAGFFVSKRYWNSEVFGKSYLALSLGMMMNAFAEMIYYAYEQQGQTPSPSIADWVWLSFYPLTFYHLAKNISFFKPKISIGVKSLVILLPILITAVYAFLEYGQEQAADTTFFLGLAYIVGSAVILSGAILGALVFRQGVLGIAWLVLALGIVLTTIGDNWYSYLDVYNQYTLNHPVNLLWYAGYLVIAYALYKHKKII